MWEVIASFADIGRIVNHHCWNFTKFLSYSLVDPSMYFNCFFMAGHNFFITLLLEEYRVHMWDAISKIQTITKQRKGKQNNICMDKLREISSTNDSLLLFTNQFYFGCLSHFEAILN